MKRLPTRPLILTEAMGVVCMAEATEEVMEEVMEDMEEVMEECMGWGACMGWAEWVCTEWGWAQEWTRKECCLIHT